MAKNKIIISASLFLLFFITKAYSCEDVRLDLDPQILGRVPPGDQGKTSGCFAETAAQLIDAYRFSHGDKDFDFLTSSIVLGAESGDLLNLGGSIESALHQARLQGTCDRKEVLRKLGTKNSSEFLEILAKNYDLGRGKKDTPTLALSGGSKSQHFSAADELNLEESFPASVTFEAEGLNKPQKLTVKRPIEKTYTKDQNLAAVKLCNELVDLGITSPAINTLLKLMDGSRTRFVREILAGLCKERKNLISLPSAVTEDFWKNPMTPPSDKVRVSSLKSSIDKILGSKKQPVGIEFCNEAVTVADHAGKYDKSGEWICQNNGQHAAVVVGSKKNLFGSCSYLVRDSYCSQYSKKLGLSRRSGMQDKKDFCQDGQYWIPADQLLKNTRAVIHY